MSRMDREHQKPQ